jgi:polyhydroxyalkanoate synthesis regulator phasin
MRDTVRRYVDAGREALTSKRAEDMARALVKQGQARRDQASKVARDLTVWSRRSSERLREIIRREVSKQIARGGMATKDEVEALKRRIRDLERSAAQRAPAAKSPAKSSAGRPARKPATARPARKSTAPRPAPKSRAKPEAGPTTPAPPATSQKPTQKPTT